MERRSQLLSAEADSLRGKKTNARIDSNHVGRIGRTVKIRDAPGRNIMAVCQGIDMDELAAQPQKEGVESLVKSLEEMMDVVAKQAQAVKGERRTSSWQERKP
jgi:hypothetical protein